MMASEDVIELGSSDDDAEPVPKKAKVVPNAMVHIPKRFHEGHPFKKSKTTPVLEKLLAKPLTVKKVPNPLANKSKLQQKPEQKRIIVHTKHLKHVATISNPQLTVNKIPGSKVSNHPLKVVNPKSITIQNSGSIANLPPGIIVKRTSQNPGNAKIHNKQCSVKPIKTIVQKGVSMVPTVDLDDDDCVPSTTGSPQWYLRPEDQNEILKFEKKKNEEPEPLKCLEIVIDDSPIKAAPNKRNHIKNEQNTCPAKASRRDKAFKVGAEFAITIDDSPVKPAVEKKYPLSGSDDEMSDIVKKEPNSRKQLEYPKESGTANTSIEIELVPIDITVQDKENVDDPKQLAETLSNNEVIEVKDDSQKDAPEIAKQKEENMNVEEANKEISVDKEFHPVYQEFIDVCFKLENSEDMKKIVEKRIKPSYKRVPKEYTESEMFIDLVSSKITLMETSPANMYLYIKDIVDELKVQRKMTQSQVSDTLASKSAPTKEESNKFLYGEDRDFSPKRQRQIRKLEKTIKKLHRAIQLLEEQEVDFDDEDDSVYLLTERYKERMVKVHAKFCQLTNTKMPSEPRLHVDARPGRPSGPAKKLEKWINKKVPIGTPLPFPDFHDVLRCVKEANENDRLGWNEADIMEEARDLFVRCGKKLQRRRQENEWRLAASRIAANEDPAEKDQKLKEHLASNKTLAAKREVEIFNKFADKQNQLKLEAEEIGDKEAEESPLESEGEQEEDDEEETSLKNKEQRKERLKRLLQENSKATRDRKQASENKENNRGTLEKKDITVEKNEVSVEKNYDGEELGKKLNADDVENELDRPSTSSSAMKEDDDDKVLTLSDDSNEIDSDFDELHLLQRLRSVNEVQSSPHEFSDSDSPIAISDHLDSSDENKAKYDTCDVISIENSSYSESEANKSNTEQSDNEGSKPVCLSDEEGSVDLAPDVENSNKINSDDPMGNIENTDEDSQENSSEAETCINLDHDSISIGETVVGNGQNNDDPNRKTIEKSSDVRNELPLPGEELKVITNIHKSDVINVNKTNNNGINKVEKYCGTKTDSIMSIEEKGSSFCEPNIDIDMAMELASENQAETCNKSDIGDGKSLNEENKLIETDKNIDCNNLAKVLLSVEGKQNIENLDFVNQSITPNTSEIINTKEDLHHSNINIEKHLESQEMKNCNSEDNNPSHTSMKDGDAFSERKESAITIEDIDIFEDSGEESITECNLDNETESEEKVTENVIEPTKCVTPGIDIDNKLIDSEVISIEDDSNGSKITTIILLDTPVKEDKNPPQICAKVASKAVLSELHDINAKDSESDLSEEVIVAKVSSKDSHVSETIVTSNNESHISI